ncbi:MAG: hypothetical protein RIB71_20240 [Imperialibacter sp.]|uniref:hypothetical protein n=1 Tax=Imperialibacter sp. TaxID=2038411 RepID=UPI0032EAD7B0
MSTGISIIRSRWWFSPPTPKATAGNDLPTPKATAGKEVGRPEVEDGRRKTGDGRPKTEYDQASVRPAGLGDGAVSRRVGSKKWEGNRSLKTSDRRKGLVSWWQCLVVECPT